MKTKIILAAYLSALTLNANATMISEEDCKAFSARIKTPEIIASYQTRTDFTAEWDWGTCSLTSTHAINFDKLALHQAAKDKTSIRNAEEYIKSGGYGNAVEIGLKYKGFMEFREYKNLNIYQIYNYDKHLESQKFTMSIGGDPVVTPKKVVKSLFTLDWFLK